MRVAVFFGLVALTSCRSPGTTDASRGATRASDGGAEVPDKSPRPSATAAAVPAPPPVQRACARDVECAVARIEPSGNRACCPACATTPGSRVWHAQLKRWCAAHPPTNCVPLACPQGPTRAVCQSGVCEAFASNADGSPAYVAVQRRCLPTLVCDSWTGCTRASGNSQDDWFVEESERGGPGEMAWLERVSIVDAGSLEAFRLRPQDIKCKAHRARPALPPPPFECVETGGHCKRSDDGG